ncbi:hypothetical protein [Fodinicola feengrottensis]|uniref:Uncharacterized protein n=1 Tax=Fodinicola feengrottensis TaxID=435914 RepID=A0ABP4TJ96_9ACTN|nr:hypothetical protein [Fodinicola feengrottensis]
MAVPDLVFPAEASELLGAEGTLRVRDRVCASGYCPRCKEPFDGRPLSASVGVSDDLVVTVAFHADCQPAQVSADPAAVAAPTDLFSSSAVGRLVPSTYLDENGAGQRFVPFVLIHPGHAIVRLRRSEGGWRIADLDDFETAGFRRMDSENKQRLEPDPALTCEAFMDEIIMRGPGKQRWSATVDDTFAGLVQERGGLMVCVSTAWDPDPRLEEDDQHPLWFASTDVVHAWYRWVFS